MGWLDRLWYPDRPEPGLKRLALSPLSLLSLAWRGGSMARRVVRQARSLRVAARVVSVGGLTVGGAGKTPVVIFLATWASARGLRVVVLSRGHGRRASADVLLEPGGAGSTSDEVGDEPLLIARRCPEVRVWVGLDRARLAARATETLRPDLILLDDGFQHWQLARDEDLVVLDPAGLGNGHLLPRGPLREDPRALARATWIWWKEGPSSEAEGDSLPPGPVLPRVRARHAPSVLIGAGSRGDPVPASALQGKKIVAFAGLARPRGFFRTLEELGAHVSMARAFPDHHRFRARELQQLETDARREAAELITTEKDAVRLPEGFPARALRLDVEIVEGEETLPRHLLGQTPAA